MPYHRIHLSPEQDLQLLTLFRDQAAPARVRQRAEVLRLAAQGWSAPRIAKFYNCHPSTIRETFVRWWDGGIDGLYESPGRGMKACWSADDFAYLETRLLEDEQSYTADQLAELLYQQRGVRLSGISLRRILKKTATSGNAPAKVLLERIRKSRNRSTNSYVSSK